MTRRPAERAIPHDTRVPLLSTSRAALVLPPAATDHVLLILLLPDVRDDQVTPRGT